MCALALCSLARDYHILIIESRTTSCRCHLSALRMEAACSSEMMMTDYKRHSRENLLSYLGSVRLPSFAIRQMVRFCLANCSDSFSSFSTWSPPIVKNWNSEQQRDVCTSPGDKSIDISMQLGCLYIWIFAEVEGCVFMTRGFTNSVPNQNPATGDNVCTSVSVNGPDWLLRWLNKERRCLEQKYRIWGYFYRFCGHKYKFVFVKLSIWPKLNVFWKI